ncbi:MAG TPA: NapC/NirT family cytochrome c [Syntrophorhabdaceae bacterium]|nr:NapC/NirT family cytochrome c [Syntrophorhabdaceae bacterium]
MAGRHSKGILNPDFWRPIGYGAVIGAVLMLVFLGGYHYAGSSGFCGSCHSMKYVHGQWQASRHKQFPCAECHLPVGNIAVRFVYKARAGMRDLYHETVRDYPAAIRLSAEARLIANDNCLRCHFSTVENTPMTKGGQNCIKCHRYLVHARGLARGGTPFE